MVVAYLEKIRDGFIEEKIYIQTKLTETMIIYKENVEFIKLLEQNNDSNFEVFTPRAVNTFHKRKIEEIIIEQEKNEIYIKKLSMEMEEINEKIKEIDIVISIAKEKDY